MLRSIQFPPRWKNVFIQLGTVLLLIVSTSAFTTSNPEIKLSPIAKVHHAHNTRINIHEIIPFARRTKQQSLVFLKNQKDENNNSDSNDNILKRFTSPRISDAGLPIADALLAQIVAPSLQIFWLACNNAPSPTWIQPLSRQQLFATRGSLLTPTLIHGAQLACCWIMGALAAKGFESEAFDVSNGKGYGTVIERLVKAGAFAIGILVLFTQLDLFWEFGGRYVQPGDDEETDLRLLTAAVEVINDVVFEGVILGSWRLYRASLTGVE